MNKLMLPMMAGILLLSACQSEQPKTSGEKKTESTAVKTVSQPQSTSNFPYPNLLPENNQSYSLLVIGNTNEQTPIEKNEKVTNQIKNILSLPEREMVTKIYPKLEINLDSSYILFNVNGIVHQSTSLDDLTDYLKKNPIQ